MKNFKNFLSSFEEKFKNSNLYFFEFLLSSDICTLEKKKNNSEYEKSETLMQNQITDFLVQNFENDIGENHCKFYQISKIRIDSDQIFGDFEALKRKIEQSFSSNRNLFDFENKKQIIILNFFFQKEVKNKNFENFFEFLKKQFSCEKKFVLIVKETNSENFLPTSMEKTFKNFIYFIFNLKNQESIKSKKNLIFNEKFGIHEKKQIIESFFLKNNFFIADEKIKSNLLQCLILKNLFFIENDFIKFSLLEFSGQKPDQSKFIKEILESNENYKIFEILNLLLNENFEKEFLLLLEKILNKELNSIFLIRSTIHFFLKNHLYFEKKLSIENFLKILEICFDFEAKIKKPGFFGPVEKFSQALQKNLFIKILSFF